MANVGTAPLWLVILTSAAVGAAISSAITIIGQVFERRARRREMLFKAAFDHAWRYRDHLIEVSRATQRPVQIPDPVVYAEFYFEALLHLYQSGSLPGDPTIEKTKRKLADPPGES